MDPTSASSKGSRSHSFDKSGGGPVFESPCSRRGCSHIFTYSGTNPFVDLATMVTMHRRYCVGRDVRCPRTAWQAPASLVQQFTASQSVRWDRGRDCRLSFEDRHGNSMACENPWADEDWGSSPTHEGCHGASDDVAADSGWPCADGPLESECTTVAFGGQRAAIAAGAAAQGDTGTNRWQRKKTARKEAERKTLLEADPWTLTVSATQVVCGGCKQTIRLDARSRYYPGLWEKHRDRCDGIRMKRAVLAEEENATWQGRKRILDQSASRKRRRTKDAQDSLLFLVLLLGRFPKLYFIKPAVGELLRGELTITTTRDYSPHTSQTRKFSRTPAGYFGTLDLAAAVSGFDTKGSTFEAESDAEASRSALRAPLRPRTSICPFLELARESSTSEKWIYMAAASTHASCRSGPRSSAPA
ncbi:hypothetical protein GGX14DRAFT_694395 [Mycena pura]|uniref:Uncharacterized protein n=1 Tax=Mycena pura TaxID=153505 RepID=A0AAD6YMD2_9AGAR|nr:hypothetical protein GGX14DRAFT_694395 [Mycena pura]